MTLAMNKLFAQNKKDGSFLTPQTFYYEKKAWLLGFAHRLCHFFSSLSLLTPLTRLALTFIHSLTLTLTLTGCHKSLSLVLSTL